VILSGKDCPASNFSLEFDRVAEVHGSETIQQIGSILRARGVSLASFSRISAKPHASPPAAAAAAAPGEKRSYCSSAARFFWSDEFIETARVDLMDQSLSHQTQLLTSAGFSQQQAVQALAATGGDVEAAMNW
jgi:hypothetical protein